MEGLHLFKKKVEKVTCSIMEDVNIEERSPIINEAVNKRVCESEWGTKRSISK